MRATLVAAAALLLAAAYFMPHGSASKGPYHADLVRTPGVLNPDVTQQNIVATICKPGWTKTTQYQEDHLVSLELGGHPTDPRNLWPEPYPRASDVDSIENDLNAKVCSGRLSLQAAQLQESELKHTDG